MATATDQSQLLAFLQNAATSVNATFRSLKLSTMQVIGESDHGFVRILNNIYYPFRPCQVYQKTTGTAVPSATFTKIVFDTDNYNPAHSWDYTNSHLVIAKPGVYSFTTGATFTTGASAATIFTVSLFVNGTEANRGSSYNVAATTTVTCHGAWQGYLAAGGVCDVRVFQNTGGSLTSLTGVALTYLNIQFLGNQ